MNIFTLIGHLREIGMVASVAPNHRVNVTCGNRRAQIALGLGVVDGAEVIGPTGAVYPIRQEMGEVVEDLIDALMI